MTLFFNHKSDGWKSVKTLLKTMIEKNPGNTKTEIADKDLMIYYLGVMQNNLRLRPSELDEVIKILKTGI